LILTRKYELGFQDSSKEGGYRDVYIGQSIHHEPLDETDLRNGVDAILEGGGGTFWKQANTLLKTQIHQNS
jgi:hypothetical protein